MSAEDVTDRVVLVTGSSGIARATALHFSRHGARVIVLGIDEAANDDLARADPSLLVRRADVASPAEMTAAFEALEARFGGLDVIVNCAAIHPYGDAVSTDPDVFMRCLAVNVGSIHLTAHLGVPLMRRRGGGVIVNLSSVQGHACQRGVAAYVASKGAIHALTRAMALDFAVDGIRVVSVSPGSVRTPILELAARTFDGPEGDVEAAFARFGAAHPLGRIGEPEEVAEFVAFLASPKAAFVTGSDHAIDGGLLAALGVR